MISAALREVLFQYLDGEISLGQLEELLVPLEPQLLADPDSSDADVVGTIELALVDIPAGSQTEDELRGALEAALAKSATVILAYPGNVTTESTSANRPAEGAQQTIMVGNIPIMTPAGGSITP